MTSSETTFNDAELIARLRSINKNYELARGVHVDIRQAADRIEQLAVTNEALIKELNICRTYVPEQEHIAKISQQLLICSRTGIFEAKLTLMTTERDEAWKRAAHAEKMWGEAEVKLAECEARLGKAVEALEDIVKDCEAVYPPSHGAIKYFALATLATIKGDTP